ncbi:hypothetical protein QOT17_013238 [Balamuthia mandrillaris]
MLSVCFTWRNWILTEPSFWGDSSACVRLPPWLLEKQVDTSSSLLMTRGVVVWRERLWGTGTISNRFTRISHRACLWQWRSARRELAHDASGSVSEASTYCCLHVWENLLVSGESSGYVTLWCAAPSSRYSVSRLGRFAIFELCGRSAAKENLRSLTTWRVGSEELLCCGGSKGSVHIFRTSSASVGLEYCFSLPQGSHRQAVYCMVQRGPYLITAGADPWLKVWEHRSFTNTCHCLATMNTNQAVYAMTVWNGHVCVGGSGAKVQVWNENWTLTTSLKHRRCIISLATFKGQLASGQVDGKIVIWNIFGQPIFCGQASSDRVVELVEHRDRLWAVSSKDSPMGATLGYWYDSEEFTAFEDAREEEDQGTYSASSGLSSLPFPAHWHQASGSSAPTSHWHFMNHSRGSRVPSSTVSYGSGYQTYSTTPHPSFFSSPATPTASTPYQPNSSSRGRAHPSSRGRNFWPTSATPRSSSAFTYTSPFHSSSSSSSAPSPTALCISTAPSAAPVDKRRATRATFILLDSDSDTASCTDSDSDFMASSEEEAHSTEDSASEYESSSEDSFTEENFDEEDEESEGDIAARQSKKKKRRRLVLNAYKEKRQKASNGQDIKQSKPCIDAEADPFSSSGGEEETDKKANKC